MPVKPHGWSRTRLYHIWIGMKQRCYYPKHSRFSYYGGKGIKLCQEWQDFNNFKTWAETNGYTDEMSIDRVESSKDYCPDNCQWLTISKNSEKAQSKSFRAVSP